MCRRDFPVEVSRWPHIVIVSRIHANSLTRSPADPCSGSSLRTGQTRAEGSLLVCGEWGFGRYLPLGASPIGSHEGVLDSIDTEDITERIA